MSGHIVVDPESRTMVAVSDAEGAIVLRITSGPWNPSYGASAVEVEVPLTERQAAELSSILLSTVISRFCEKVEKKEAEE